MTMRFNYQAFNQSGAVQNGTIEAESVEHAYQLLKDQRLFVKELSEEKQSGTQLFSSKKIGFSDLEYLTTEMSVLLDAGVKVDKAIDILRRNVKNAAVHQLLDKVSMQLKSGKQLSEALANSNSVFDELYVNLITIGEATGSLAEIFRSLASDLAFKRELRQKIIQAITYPAVILVICLSSIFFIFNFVVPNLESLFSGQKDLPVYTALLLGTAAWVREYQMWLLLAFGLAVALVLKFKDTPAFQDRMQKALMAVPVTRHFVVLADRIRINSGLTMMLKAGIPIDKALALACQNVKNKLLRAELEIAIQQIKRGELLSAKLQQTQLYPDFFASLLAVGEESGELERIFDEILARSQREFSSWVTRMTTLLEPLLIIVMGGIVGGVVVIMMMSITGASGSGF